ncbi:MAG: SBBP repeat-containing protein [Bryobacterales bacterium]|nr:SBBP repeat-containing protein [Bryobacterales bacterium]
MTKQVCFVFVALTPALLGATSSPAQLPLQFEPNRGQAPATVQFLARGNGYTLALSSGSASFFAGGKAATLRLDGARATAPGEGEELLPGITNYFAGADRRQWITAVPNYRQVRFRSVYRGIDLVYYGKGGELEYDFVVSPGAKPSDISFTVEGGRSPRIDKSGDLIWRTASGEVRQHRPVLFQQRDGRRVEVAGGFRVLPNGRAGFAVGAYDRSQPLTIDPVLQFSTFFGGRLRESANSLAVDQAGNLYVAGTATSPDFPVSQGAYQSSVIGGTDIFVSKLNGTGTQILYSTVVGGSGDETGAYLAVDNSGNAYVAGTTQSRNFPTTPGALKESTNALAGDTDGFVFKVNANGTNLLYSTRIGGKGVDMVNGIAVDNAATAYITGETNSDLFPLSADVVQTERKGSNDAFVMKLNPAGSGVVWSTLLGGDNDSYVVGYESGRAIGVDRVGQVYVTGITTLRDFPTTPGAPQRDHFGKGEVFLTKLNSTATQILFSTLMGGSGNDTPNALYVDPNGTNVYIAGNTASAGFPVTPQVVQTSVYGDLTDLNREGFVARYNASGQLIFSTLFGRNADDQINGVVADTDGTVWVVGTSNSWDLPTTFDAIQKNISSGGTTGEPNDAFVASFDQYAQTIKFATFLGGTRYDEGRAIARDSQGNIFVAGYTQSPSFPLTQGALQRSTGFGTTTAFIARIGENRLPASQLVMISGNNQTGDQGTRVQAPLIVELRDPFNNPIPNATITVSATNAAATGTTVRTGFDGRASILVTYGDRPGAATVTATYAGVPPVQFSLLVKRVGPPIPEILSSVVSYGESNPPLTALAPLGLGVINGRALTQASGDREAGTADYQNGQLPTSLLNTCVTVAGQAARLLYVAGHRIHFQVPEGVQPGPQPLVVISNCGILGELRSDPQTVQIRATSPEFLYWSQNPDGRNPIRAINAATGAQVTPESPANPGQTLRLFGTGFGATAPSIGAGEIPQSDYATVERPTVVFDGQELTPDSVLTSTLVPGYPGFYQLDVRLPATTRNGNLALTVKYGSQTSPMGYLRVAGGLDLEPRLSVTPARLDFGDVVINQTREMLLQITNSGAFRLNINAFDAGGLAFTVVDNEPFTLQPGESRTITVRFAPVTTSNFSTSLVIASTDPVTPTLTVPLTGAGTLQPPAPNPVPFILNIQPESILSGGAPFNLFVNGKDFTRTSVVEVNGQARPTFYNFNNQLIASLRAQDIAQAGTLTITVFTPAPGGGRSTPLTFTVTAGPQANQPLALINQLDMRFCPLITSHVSVLDGNGLPVRNLTTPSVTCREDNQVVPCTMTNGAAETPLSVMLVYGVNGITSDEDLLFLRNAARNFIAGLQPDDRIGIVHLERDARSQLDFTTDKERALNVIDILRPVTEGNGNALYDAVNYASVMAARQTGRRQAVVLFTKLDNLSGTFSLDQSLGIARTLGVPFYTVVVGGGESNINLTGYLRQLSRDTNGQFFTENRPLSYNDLFQRIKTIVQSQYSITHYSPVFDGRDRPLTMTFSIPEGTVSATRVYRPCAPGVSVGGQ